MQLRVVLEMAVPSAVSVLQFVEDAKQDIKSPSTSVFPSKMAAYKNMVSNLDEVSIVQPCRSQYMVFSLGEMFEKHQRMLLNN